MKILNLTKHVATPEQITQGVFEPNGDDKANIIKLLTFDSLPTCEEIRKRAEELAYIATGYSIDNVMLDGYPYLMRTLEDELDICQIAPMYSFSINGSHVGFFCYEEYI